MDTISKAVKLCPEWIALLEEGQQTGAVELSMTLLIENEQKHDNPLMSDLLHSWLTILQRRKYKKLRDLLLTFQQRHQPR